ncbi:phage tail tube protein [Microvirga massiliensis]|uniref:phage tail tube protein n=1 Tax=Microvirga massiliensis TaxID=1033741 RepID=UPI00062B7E62|nr:phage tail tube protein [Microvirga massiliensis]
MPIVTASGTRFFIGPSVLESVDTVEEFEDLTDWTEIGLVETYGEVGDESSAVTFAAVGDSRVRKAKGARDAGTMALTVAHDPMDEGQTALDAAEGTNLNFAFRIEYPDKPNATGTGTIEYFRGLVMSRRRNIGGNDNVIRRTYSIGVNSQMFEVKATAGV